MKARAAKAQSTARHARQEPRVLMDIAPWEGVPPRRHDKRADTLELASDIERAKRHAAQKNQTLTAAAPPRIAATTQALVANAPEPTVAPLAAKTNSSLPGRFFAVLFGAGGAALTWGLLLAALGAISPRENPPGFATRAVAADVFSGAKNIGSADDLSLVRPQISAIRAAIAECTATGDCVRGGGAVDLGLLAKGAVPCFQASCEIGNARVSVSSDGHIDILAIEPAR